MFVGLVFLFLIFWFSLFFWKELYFDGKLLLVWGGWEGVVVLGGVEGC